MARFYGAVGYGESVENPLNSGIWKDMITEFPYTGDVIRNTRKLEDSEQLNDNITVANSISIVADQYAIDHFMKIKYVNWAGVLWTISTVEVRSPRLILTLGKIYNGPTPIEVIPNIPLFDGDEIIINDQNGIIYKDASDDSIMNFVGSPYLVADDEIFVVNASPTLGYFIPSSEDNTWTFIGI